MCGELSPRSAQRRRCGRFIPACAGNSVRGLGSRRRIPVHPRVCGELASTVGEAQQNAGSSPRVRGTPPRQRGADRHRRFIPACAGNSGATATARASTAVHPRVCGELPRRQPHLALGNRFIPACAGNSEDGTSATLGRTVHPRVCGELSYQPGAVETVDRFIPACAGNSSRQRIANRAVDGSSPRVRGTRALAVGNVERQRFIPACAGNSPPRGCRQPQSPVHPRVCGELEIVAATDDPYRGSSPRVRGTPRLRGRGVLRDRFIPACAGNSRAIRRSVSCLSGSSPRVRGTLARRRADRTPRRFIPACAGNSAVAEAEALTDNGSSPRVRGTRLGQGSRCLAVPVHPRVCGELQAAAHDHHLGNGSSPRVRGTLGQGALAIRGGRFIPACAGNSLAHLIGVPATARFIPACAGNSVGRKVAHAIAAVHPRVCGELFQFGVVMRSFYGSSPRVRGTPVGVPPAISLPRFIPACAGNSRRLPLPPSDPSVHPRVCGELRASSSTTKSFAGSSPRVRGTRSAVSGAIGSRPVHPRVCGELRPGQAATRSASGSSPRVRGTPRRIRPGISRGRFIPACAGNSRTGSRRASV